jgi:hypothetical protein
LGWEHIHFSEEPMIRVVEAVIDEGGNVRLLAAGRLPQPRRAIVAILDESPVTLTTTPLFTPTVEPEAKTRTAGPTSPEKASLAGPGGDHQINAAAYRLNNGIAKASMS